MSIPQPAPLAFHAEPLFEPIDPQQAAAFARSVQPHRGSQTAATVVALVIGGVAVMGILGIAVSIIAILIAVLPLMGILIAVLLLGFVALVVVIVCITVPRARRRREAKMYRLHRFAAANGMSYAPAADAPPLPGMIFGIGRDRRSLDLVRGLTPRFVEFANYSYTTGSGKSEVTHHWGYVAVNVSNMLPNIVLDAKANNGLGSNLPVALTRDQRLKLEGDFDDHFTLYCPAGYETDALYLFTPDIMERFITHAAALDVELVDDWVFFYANRELSTLDPAVWQWLFTTVRAVLQKIAQWDRWRDDRLAGPAVGAPVPPVFAPGPEGPVPPLPAPFARPVGVAPPGRRLRRSTWLAWIGLGVMLVVMFGSIVVNVLAAFLPLFVR